jgi:hypothetical protein
MTVRETILMQLRRIAVSLEQCARSPEISVAISDRLENASVKLRKIEQEIRRWKR